MGNRIDVSPRTADIGRRAPVVTEGERPAGDLSTPALMLVVGTVVARRRQILDALVEQQGLSSDDRQRLEGLAIDLGDALDELRHHYERRCCEENLSAPFDQLVESCEA